MTPATTYFWRQDKLEIVHRRVFIEDFRQSSMLKYLYCPCAIYSAEKPNKTWIGHFNQSEKFEISYHHYARSDLPNEFKLALLIAGVQL
jgi:hypothetical protein